MRINRVVLVALLALLPRFSQAKDRESFTQGGFLYYVCSDSTVAIADDSLTATLPISEDSTLVVLSSVIHNGKEYRVERIKEESFQLRPEIKRLVISEGVEYINDYAFARCSNLQHVSLPSTIAYLQDDYRRESLFYGCSNLTGITIDARHDDYDSRDSCNAIIRTEDSTLIWGCKGTRIPSSVRCIGQYAFSGNEGMNEIIVPEGVKKIEFRAFENCPNLKSISLPSSLESIGTFVFSGCASLTSITIPENVTEVTDDGEGNLFGGCYNLREVKVDKRNRKYDSRKNSNAIIDTERDVIVAACGNSVIPDGVKGIGRFAFAGTSIPAIHVPSSVGDIGERAFANCWFCNAISVSPKNRKYDSRDNCNAIIETATGKLVQGCSRTTIPNGTKEIGNFAFEGVRLPPYLIIAEGVEVIGEWVFTRHCGMKYVKMPSTLKLIKEQAFSYCEDLQYVDITLCSPRIEGFAFPGCPRLQVVDFSPSIGDIDKSAFFRSPCAERVKKQMERMKKIN